MSVCVGGAFFSFFAFIFTASRWVSPDPHTPLTHSLLNRQKGGGVFLVPLTYVCVVFVYGYTLSCFDGVPPFFRLSMKNAVPVFCKCCCT